VDCVAWSLRERYNQLLSSRLRPTPKSNTKYESAMLSVKIALAARSTIPEIGSPPPSELAVIPRRPAVNGFAHAIDPKFVPSR
jgi:hypothetical protein